MMHIGTSLGGCLKSVMAGEVSKDNVLFIVTRTNCPTYEKFVGVVKQYYAEGNPWSRNAKNYSFDGYELEEVLDVAHDLWHAGKIHQPRTYGTSGDYVHEDLGGQLWIEVIPPKKMQNPAVSNTWEKLKMLVSLTQ
jgi:hypothetical protein